MRNFEDVKREPGSARAQNPRAGRQPARGRAQTRQWAALTVSVVGLACLGLSACGGGSSGTSSVAAATTGTTATSAASAKGTSSTGAAANTPAASGAVPKRFAAIRECLQKNGITLPKRSPGSGPPPGTNRLGLPKGVTAQQYQAAVKKCGGGGFGAGAGAFRRANSPVFRQALSKYGECLRQNGINIPAPNTSGKGPIFSTKGIDTTSPKFKAATMKCRATLIGAFRSVRPNGGVGTGTPPAGGTPKSAEASR